MCWWLAPWSSGVLHTVPFGWTFLLQHSSHILKSSSSLKKPLYITSHSSSPIHSDQVYSPSSSLSIHSDWISSCHHGAFHLPHTYANMLCSFCLLSRISTLHPTAVFLLCLVVVLSNSVLLLECNLLLLSSLLRLSSLNSWTQSTSFASSAMSPPPYEVGSKL